MSKDPAFLFYSKDWITGTSEMLPLEKGVYIDLLCHQHQNDSLPAQTQRLAMIVRMSHDEFLKVWDCLKVKFEERDGRLYNRKLEEVREERSAKSYRNKIIALFKQAMRRAALSPDEYEIVRKKFKIELFEDAKEADLSELINEWVCANKCERTTKRTTERTIKRTKSIANGNGNANEDVNAIVLEGCGETFCGDSINFVPFRQVPQYVAVVKAYREVFLQQFQREPTFGTFDPKDLNAIAIRLVNMLNARGQPADNDAVAAMASMSFRSALLDKWLKENFTPGNLEKRLDTIINKLKQKHEQLTGEFVTPYD
jgi:uncharacterized protein YdaU (DUF1376 family)